MARSMRGAQGWFRRLPLVSRVIVASLALLLGIGVSLLMALLAYFPLGMLGFLGEPDESDFYVVLFVVVALMLLGGIAAYLLRHADPAIEWWERFRASRATSADRSRELQVTLQREREVGVEVALPPEAALERVVEKMTRGGWGLSNQTRTTATFARDEGADCCLGCFLTLLFVLPGLLYLYLYNKTSRLTVVANPHEGGSRLVIGGDNPGAVAELSVWARGLAAGPNEPQASEPPASEESAIPQARGSSILAQKLRELAELRDAGLISPEEFEAKRKDLLDKM